MERSGAGSTVRWSLTREALARLLGRLDPDPDAAGRAYEALRVRLVDFFDWKGAHRPEVAAEETLDRVARRLEEGEAVERVEPYAYGVARLVLLEHLRLQLREQRATAVAVHEPAGQAEAHEEARIACLTRCLQQLSADDRSLIVCYYEGAGRSHLEGRKELATRLGIVYATLKTRAHRLRVRLEACLRHCLDAPGPASMTGATTDREAEFRAYLLGVLPPERQEEIDERFLADAEFHAELQATADDLIHAYLGGELPAAERQQFETHFLASPRRRERVAFVRSLVAAVERVQRPAVAAPRPSRLASMLPWAAMLVFGLAAGGWSIGEKRRSNGVLAEARQREESLRAQLLAQDERVRELERLTRPSSEPADVATWTLRSSAERGPASADGFTVRGEWIRLRVLLEHDLRVASYRASLQTSEGREVLRVGGLREASRSAGRTVDVMVPAGLLAPGHYLLSVQRDAGGAPEELTATTFLVR